MRVHTDRRPRRSRWNRPLDRIDAAIGGLAIFSMLFLTGLSVAGVITENWMPKFLVGWFLFCLVGCGALYLLARPLGKLVQLIVYLWWRIRRQ